ncbi:hypothetical protein [Xanthomonas phage X1]|nr:hypothetical protein [Xanthomonas phage X1]
MLVAEKKRKNMKHFREMNDRVFCEWILGYEVDQLDLSWKLDGFFLRFGKDKENKPWFQTARSPVLYDPMEIIWHSLEKGYDHTGMSRAEVYFHLIKTIWDSNIMNHLPEDSGFECEVFDKSMSVLNRENNTRTFVNIPYDEEFFKTDLTLAIYKLIEAATAETWIDGYYCDLNLDDNIQTFGTRFKIDFTAKYYFECGVKGITGNGKLLPILESRRQADRETKLGMKAVIATLKDQFCYYVLKQAQDHHKMGKNFEGVVITVNKTEYKIVTDYFRDLIYFKGVMGG